MINVVIVEDNRTVREGLVCRLTHQRGVKTERKRRMKFPELFVECFIFFKGYIQFCPYGGSFGIEKDKFLINIGYNPEESYQN